MKGNVTFEDGSTGTLTIEASLGSTEMPAQDAKDVFVSLTVKGMYFDGFIDRVITKETFKGEQGNDGQQV